MRRILATVVAVAAMGAATETVYVKSESVELRSGKGAVYPSVANVPKGAELTVTAHEGHWLLVTVSGKSGYVFDGALATEKPSGELFANPTLDTGMTEGAAGKGLDPNATAFASGKNLNPEPLNKLIAERQKIDPKEWEAFAAEGKVGPSKP